MRPNFPELKVPSSDDDGALTIMIHNANGRFHLHLVKVGVNTRVVGWFLKGYFQVDTLVSLYLHLKKILAGPLANIYTS